MMSKFESMTDLELRQHFLQHRDDESFHAYMDRRKTRPKRVVLSVEETKLPVFEQMNLVEERMRSRIGNKIQETEKPNSDQPQL